MLVATALLVVCLSYMNNRLYGESVSDDVIEHETNSLQTGLTSARLVIGAGAVVLSQTSPWLGILTYGAGELLNLVMNKVSQSQSNRVKSVLKQVVERIPEQQLLAKMETDEEYADFFVKGLKVALEAREKSRLEAIGFILLNGFDGDYKLIIAKKCLNLMQELDDVQLATFFKISRYIHEEPGNFFTYDEMLEFKQFLLSKYRHLPIEDVDDVADTISDSMTKLVKSTLVIEEVTQNHDGPGTVAYNLFMTPIGKRLSYYIRDLKEPTEIAE